MKLLMQRTLEASVKVNGETVGSIDEGLLLFVGIEKEDNSSTLIKMASRVLNYRVFSDHEKRMNLSVSEIRGGLLVISQFTLAANTSKGLRPSFSSAASPERAQSLYTQFVDLLKQQYSNVQCGIFGADMKVALVNDGPVTFLLEG